MPKLRIPTPLRSYAGGQNEIHLQGETVAKLLEDLLKHYPALRPHLTNGEGELRPFVNLYLNEDNIRELQGMDTPLSENDRLMLIPSIAGGSRPRHRAS